MNERGIMRWVAVRREGRMESLRAVMRGIMALGVKGAVSVRRESLVDCDLRVLAEAERRGSGEGVDLLVGGGGGGEGLEREKENWSRRARVVVRVVVSLGLGGGILVDSLSMNRSRVSLWKVSS